VICTESLAVMGLVAGATPEQVKAAISGVAPEFLGGLLAFNEAAEAVCSVAVGAEPGRCELFVAPAEISRAAYCSIEFENIGLAEIVLVPEGCVPSDLPTSVHGRPQPCQAFSS